VSYGQIISNRPYVRLQIISSRLYVRLKGAYSLTSRALLSTGE